MTKKMMAQITATALIGVLAMPVLIVAHDQSATHEQNSEPTRYTLIDRARLADRPASRTS